MNIFRWLLPKNSPPLPTNAKGDQSIKIDEPFEKSKKNLLWFSTLSILIGYASFMVTDNNCFTFSMVGNFNLPPSFIAILLFLYGCYHFWLFEYQLKRVEARNSPVFHKAADDSFSTNIQEIGDELEMAKKVLSNYKMLDFNKTLTSISNIENILNAPNLSTVDVAFDEFREKTHLLIEKSLRNRTSTEPAGLADEIMALQEQVSHSTLSLKDKIDFIVRQTMDTVSTTKLTWKHENETVIGVIGDIEQTANNISLLKTSVGRLSDQIRDADTQKFAIADTWVPRVMAIIALMTLGITILSAAVIPDHSVLSCTLP